MRDEGSFPPAVIINLAYTGLALARSLSRRGVRVIGLVGRPGQYGRLSRCCEVRACPDPRQAPAALLDYLVQLGRELSQPAVLFPTSDFDVLLVARHQEALRPYFRLPLPAAEVVERVMDKAALCRAAQACGVPVPRTLVCRSAAEVEQGGRTAGYPCIVKPVYSYQWHEGDNWKTVGHAKAIAAASPAELSAAYERVARVTPEVLLQEFVPGGDANIFVAGMYVARDGRATGFTACKLLQYPPQLGTGYVVAQVDESALLAQATRLLAHLGYTGIAEVEFKRDSVRGVYKLIEVNARFWDWHALSRAAGVDLAGLAYADLAGQPPPMPGPRLPGACWLGEEGLALHLREALRRRAGGNSARLPLRVVLSHRRLWGIFAWRDPLPFVAFAGDQARLLARAAAARLAHRAAQ